MKDSAIDVIIPVHSESRPVQRAVRSVVDHTRVPTLVTVVAHHVDAEAIRARLGDLGDHPDVRVVPFADGLRSPSGPRNHGLDITSAPSFAFLDSDDELAPGALDVWHGVAAESRASVVIPRLEIEGSGVQPLPPTRPGRTRDLRAVRDRLAYRCTPFGLISRRTHGGLRFTPRLESGEDLAYSAALWFLGSRIAYDRNGPAHIMHTDGTDRVTSEIRSVDADFAFLDAIAASEWYPRLRRTQKRALGVKNFRLHFFDAVLARLTSPEGLAPHRAALTGVARQIEAMGRGSLALLSRTDRAIIDAVSAPAPDSDEVLRLLEARWNGSLDTALPRNPLRAVHRQGPRWTLRDMVA